MDPNSAAHSTHLQTANSSEKPKRRRRACDQCTVAKTRCDGLEPFCTRCSKRGWPCNFSQRRRSGPKRKRSDDTDHLAIGVANCVDSTGGGAVAVTPTDENGALVASAWPPSRASFMLRGDPVTSLRRLASSPATLGAGPSFGGVAAGGFYDYGMPGQDQQQPPFFACGPSIVPDTSMGMMQVPRMAMPMSPASPPSPQPMALTPAHVELAALQADPRYLIHYMEMVNSFLPLAEPTTLAEALATMPPPTVVPDFGSTQEGDASETALVAADTMQARAAAQQALLWAAVGLGALYSGNDAFAARQMRKSRAYLQRCFDTAEPELVSIFLQHVLYHFYKVDVKKVQKYIGYAQQAARDASAGSLRPGVAASLRFMSALMHTSVTTAVVYDSTEPRAPEALSRIGGPRRFLAIIEEVFFNMSLAFPPSGGGSYVDPSLPTRLKRALQEADAMLEAAERPSMIAKACAQGLHTYFQLASGQTDLGLRAAERMAKTVVQAPGTLHFPPAYVLSRGVSGVLQACNSRPAAHAIEAAMAPFRAKVVYANSVCSIGRELLRVMAPPPATPPAMGELLCNSDGNAIANVLADFEDKADFVCYGGDYIDGGCSGDDFAGVCSNGSAAGGDFGASGSIGSFDDPHARNLRSTSSNYTTDGTIGFPGPSPSPSCDSVSSAWSGNSNVPASPAPQLLTPSPPAGPGREVCLDRSVPGLASLVQSLSQGQGSEEVLGWQRRLLQQQLSLKGLPPQPQQQQVIGGSSGLKDGLRERAVGDGLPVAAAAAAPSVGSAGMPQNFVQQQQQEALPAGGAHGAFGSSGGSNGGAPPALDQLTQDMLFDLCQEDTLLESENMSVVV